MQKNSSNGLLAIWVSKSLVLIYTDCHKYLRVVGGQHEPTSFFGSAAAGGEKTPFFHMHFLCMCNLALQAAFRAFALLEWCNTFLTKNQVYFEQFLIQYLLICTRPVIKIWVINSPLLFFSRYWYIATSVKVQLVRWEPKLARFQGCI